MVSGAVLSDEVSYSKRNISVHILPAPSNTDGILGKIKLMLYSPIWIWKSYKLLTPKDVIMARAPDSIGFLGWLISRFTRLPRFAKFANQWENYENEPLGYRIQKICYRARNFGGPVMIYGEGNDRHPHLIPFFPPGISHQDWEKAEIAAERRMPPPPFRLLFVGRFFYIKGADILMEAVKFLNDWREDLVVDLIGDGPERPFIQEQISRYGLANIYLHGWFVWRRRWPNPPFSARLRWWEVTLLLASFRLLDPRNGGLVEALGRFWGMLTLISNKPAETLEKL